MKHTSNKWPKRMFAGALSIVAIFAVITLTGCGEESKSSKTRNNNYVGVGGVGGVGPNGSNVLYSGLGNSTSGQKVQAALDFYIAQNGGVVAQGEMYAFSLGSYGCSVPVGSYTVSTEQAGAVDSYGGSVSGVRLVANGPVQIRMTVRHATFFQATPYRRACNNELFASDMYAYISIDSVNGYSCSYSAVSVGYNPQFTCAQ